MTPGCLDINFELDYLGICVAFNVKETFRQ